MSRIVVGFRSNSVKTLYVVCMCEGKESSEHN